MKNAVVIDVKDYVRKHYRLILVSIIAAVICFGFQSLNGNIRIDTEELLNEPGTTLGWLTIGRFGLVFFKGILGLQVHNAIKSGLLFLLFFCMGSNVLTFSFYHFSGKNEKYPYWMFLLLYGTSSIWSYQVYFSLQQAEVALAMLLTVIAAFLSVRACFVTMGKGNLIRIVVSTAFLVMSLGAYQALAAYYITICIAFFLLHLGKAADETGAVPTKSQCRTLWRGIGGLLLQFAAAYVAYVWIANTWFMAAGGYMENQMGWGRLTVLGCVKNVLRTMKNTLLCYGPRNFSFYTLGVLFACAAGVLVFRKRLWKERYQRVLFVLAMAGMLLSPFLMTIYMGEMLVTRSQFALPVTAAFLGMFGIGIITDSGYGKKWFMQIAVSCVLLITAAQAGYNLRLTYTDYIRFRQDQVLTDRLIAELKTVNKGEFPEIPVIFVGYRKPALDGLCARTEMYGWSFYEWDYNKENPTGATHRIAGFVQADTGNVVNEESSEEMRAKAVELAEEMPDFPAKGAVLSTEEFIVVRLSEVTDRTDLNWW